MKILRFILLGLIVLSLTSCLQLTELDGLARIPDDPPKESSK